MTYLRVNNIDAIITSRILLVKRKSSGGGKFACALLVPDKRSLGHPVLTWDTRPGEEGAFDGDYELSVLSFTFT